MSHEREFTVEVMRETWATRTYRVKAKGAEEAKAKALEEAGDDDWTGSAYNSDYEVTGILGSAGEKQEG
jgi:hypothetical protein